MSEYCDNIPGNENMNEAEKSYFEHFGDKMYDQVEVILSQNNIDSETMRDEYTSLMNNLASNPYEYIVEGAQLVCSMQIDDEQKFRDGDGAIISNPKAEDIINMSKLIITDDRRASLAEYTPAIVKDVKGGLRDEDEGLNITSFGNCKCIKKVELKLWSRKVCDDFKMPDADKKIRDAIAEGKGTCYCYMDLNPEWENLPVDYNFETESFEGNSNSISSILKSSTAGVNRMLSSPYMMFNGEQGINMMSILFCKRGGIITAREPGQKNIIYEAVMMEIRIKNLTNTIGGEEVDSVEALVNLCSVEVLARVIYQEQKYKGERAGQNAVMFSILNRLFLGDVTRSINSRNHIYSIITGNGQYESIMVNGEKYPNAFHPPKDSPEWENAKRLAAILYIAIEEYGHSEYDSEVNITGSTKGGIVINDRDENVVDVGDLETREAVINFIQEQCDIDKNKIINEIETRKNIVANHTGEPFHPEGIIIGRNEFY